MSGGISASTLATVAIGTQVVGAVTGAQGARAQSEAAQNAYNYQSQVNANNAKIAEWQAQDAISRGAKAEQAQRQKIAQVKGSQRASFAARGIDISEGSALNILEDTDYTGNLDINTIRDNTAKEAWGYRNQAAGYSSDASMLASRADAEDSSSAMFGSLLTSAGSVASSWYNYKTKTKG